MRATFFKLRNFVVLGGKLLQALVQKSRGKQHSELGVAAACAAVPCIHYVSALSGRVTAVTESQAGAAVSARQSHSAPNDGVYSSYI